MTLRVESTRGSIALTSASKASTARMDSRFDGLEARLDARFDA